MKQVFDLLMTTGAERWLNEPSSLDDEDAAGTIALVILTRDSDCDLNPLNGYSVVHRMIPLSLPTDRLITHK